MIAQCLNGPVQAGDMVKVVLPTMCCGVPDGLGNEYRVILVRWMPAACRHCGARHDGLVCCVDNSNEGHLPGCLVRLDPPALPEGIETVREVTA